MLDNGLDDVLPVVAQRREPVRRDRHASLFVLGHHLRLRGERRKLRLHVSLLLLLLLHLLLLLLLLCGELLQPRGVDGRHGLGDGNGGGAERMTTRNAMQRGEKDPKSSARQLRREN